MKRTHFGGLGWWFAAASMVLGSAVLAQAAPSAKGGDESREAAQVLREIKADAMHVRSAAAHLDSLTQGSSATWLEYDARWNEIKPAVEDMQVKLARLESMQASISSAECNDIDQYKQFIQEIQNRTAQLRGLLDTPGVQTSDAKFGEYARGLMNEAFKIEKTPSAS